jgi:hypothetical protein
VSGLRSVWLNLLLIGLALASSLAVVFTRDSVTSAELMGRADHLFQVFRPEKVTQISVETGGRHVLIRKQAAAPSRATPAADAPEADGDAGEHTAASSAEPDVAAVWMSRCKARPR